MKSQSSWDTQGSEKEAHICSWNLQKYILLLVVCSRILLESALKKKLEKFYNNNKIDTDFELYFSGAS